LSNEIYYEIFEYLDSCDIYKTFYNLNTRFRRLITSSSLLLKISLDNESRLDMKHHCRQIVDPNKHRTISLHLRNSIQVKEFFTYCTIDSFFNRLESIVFYGVLPSKFLSILSYLQSLPRLFTLTIKLNNDDECYISLADIYRKILRLPFLKSNSLAVSTENELSALVPLSINERLSNIKYLSMHHMCTVDELTTILYHTPQLSSLTCRNLIGLDCDVESEVSVILPNLKHVHIINCSVKFDEFEKFMKKISLKLKVLRIDRFTKGNHIYPDRWKELILQSMPQLLTFDLMCYMKVNDIYLDSFMYEFTSSFWIERGWIFGVEIQSEQICYSINSNKYLKGN
jgi:hypothetical protein